MTFKYMPEVLGVAFVAAYVWHIASSGTDMNLGVLHELEIEEFHTIDYDGFSQESEGASEETIVFSEDTLNEMSNYTYGVVKISSYDNIEHVIEINLNDKTITQDSVKHNYQRNETFLFEENEWVEVEDDIEILDWDVLSMNSMLDVLPYLLGDYWFTEETLGVVQGDYTYYTWSRDVQLDDTVITGSVTYMLRKGVLISVIVEVDDIVNSLQFVDLG